MKKVFWTSVFWIIVMLWLVVYMKCFDQQLAYNFANFLIKWNLDVDVECNFPVSDYELVLDWTEMDNIMVDPQDVNQDNEDELWQNIVECNCPIVEFTWNVEISENWDNLFTQLNRIEKIVRSNNTSIMSDEELFEQFKQWRSANEE